ncbi:MAG: hypothetical protein K2X35_16300 [Bryobacteraceae bacterium]|nr:hypothetical protein [Bryobacteraceae bacterium]
MPCLAVGWQRLGPFGGSATAIAVDPRSPKTLVAGARNSLLYRSDDGGENWRLLGFPRHFRGSIQALWIDPKDSNRYLAGVHLTGSADAGLHESLDGGATWKHIADLEGISIEALASFPGDSDRMLAGTRKGVFLSADGGRSWKRISPADDPELQAITAVSFDPENPRTIFAGTTHLPWKTTDEGATWKSIRTGMLDDSDVFSIYVDPRRPSRVFASACSGIYRSLNGGANWRKFLGIPGTHRRTHVIRQDPANAEMLFAGTTVGLLRSTDGGATWQQKNDLPVNSLAFDPTDPKVLYLASEHGGIWKSADSGETFQPLNRGFVSRRVNAVTSSGEQLYLNTVQDGPFGGVFASADQGGTWRLSSASLNGESLLLVAGVPDRNGVVFAASESRLYRSADSGRTWKAAPFAAVAPLVKPAAKQVAKTAPARARAPRKYKIMALRAVPSDGGVAILLGTDRGLFRGTALGDGWKEVVSSAHVLSIHDSGANIAVRTMDGLLISQDGGRTFRNSLLPLPVDMIYDVAISAAAPAALLIATANGLLRSTDGGATWLASPSGLPHGTVRAVRFHPRRDGSAYAVQYGQLFATSDSGATWSPVAGAELEDKTIRDLWFPPGTPDRLMAVTDDTGLYLLNLLEVE